MTPGAPAQIDIPTNDARNLNQKSAESKSVCFYLLA
jgi:hypothetical protein